jgi:hypothetical protein
MFTIVICKHLKKNLLITNVNVTFVKTFITNGNNRFC